MTPRAPRPCTTSVSAGLTGCEADSRLRSWLMEFTVPKRRAPGICCLRALPVSPHRRHRPAHCPGSRGCWPWQVAFCQTHRWGKSLVSSSLIMSNFKHKNLHPKNKYPCTHYLCLTRSNILSYLLQIVFSRQNVPRPEGSRRLPPLPVAGHLRRPPRWPCCRHSAMRAASQAVSAALSGSSSCAWFAFALSSLSRCDCALLSEDTGCVLTFRSVQLSGALRRR